MIHLHIFKFLPSGLIVNSPFEPLNISCSLLAENCELYQEESIETHTCSKMERKYFGQNAEEDQTQET